ncbi:MAG: hypothetical protein JWN87_3059 [Frankiales bacterium]|nr:hypothetical protein [Frankiales bacterium]
MRHRLGSLSAVATGALVLRLVLVHGHTAYVKPSAGPMLVAAAVVLLLAGGAGLLPSAGTEHAPPRVAGLLLVPAVLLVVIAPPSLGASYAQHAGVAGPRPGDSGPLRIGADGVAALSLWQVVGRVERGSSLTGVPVRLTGFVAGADREGRALLTRFSVRCCAADATVSQVAVALDRVPAKDTWLTVVGTVVARDGQVPVLQPRQVAATAEPDDPYEG